MVRVALICCALLAFGQLCAGFPKPAKKTLGFSLSHSNNASVNVVSSIKWMTLTLGKGAEIDFKGTCDSAESRSITLEYHLLVTRCAGLLEYADELSVMGLSFNQDTVHGTELVELSIPCGGAEDNLQFNEKKPEEVWKKDAVYNKSCFDPMDKATYPTNPNGAAKKDEKNKANSKRSVLSTDYLLSLLESSREKRSDGPRPSHKKQSDTEVVCVSRERNIYALAFKVSAPNQKGLQVNVTIHAEMVNRWGYLSAVDYPNLLFYGIMTAVYVIYGFAWLLAMMCQYKDLLRVQFWVGAVIALGMFEKVFFFSQFNIVNSNGLEETPSLLATAELVSAAKRTLARLLVIIVSLGFGIVKPRLGANLVLVIGIGIVYFAAASVEGISRVVRSSEEIGSGRDRVLVLAISLLDVGIVYFIYASITDTMRTLRLRRNIVKLSLYRHFSNAIIFAVLASCIFLTWSYIQFRPSNCVTDWQEMWVRDGFWHILFSFLLLTMMLLWRPSANNNRYAYSPLVDLGSNEDEPEQMPSEAFDGMKLRSLGQARKGAAPMSTIDDDLKWVEENIPTSLVDAAVPVLMDSEDELTTARTELSKMQ